jgi:subtilase family serine protease
VNRSAPGCNRGVIDGDGLIVRVAAGDDGALRELFCRPASWPAAHLRVVLPAAEVEAVLPETFVGVWRGAAGAVVHVTICRTRLLVAGAAVLAMVAATTLAACGSTNVRRPQAGPARGSADCISVATCYTPQQLEAAYSVRPLLHRGIDGRGQTVVLPELAESQLSPPLVTDLRQDFLAFDQLFHLPAPHLRFVSTFAGLKEPWLAYGEEVLDAEVVHTIAPGAALTVVLVKGTSLDSAGQAVAASVAALRLGASEGGIISLSPAGQIGGEHCVNTAQLTQLNAALHTDADRHVTVVAATGDSGAAGEPCALIDALSGGISRNFTPRKEPILLASDPLVLSAGGTALDASHKTGAWIAETAWGLPDGSPGTGFQASGGGFSHLFRRPSYQNGVAGVGAYRGVPDVAADANPSTGFPVVTSNTGGGYTISGHGGTSASAPLWAGIIALADQYAKRRLGFVNPAIYQIARSTHYHQAFHDITAGPANTAEFPTGTITGYRASPGWDPVTGWGSPNAEVLVPLLARNARS